MKRLATFALICMFLQSCGAYRHQPVVIAQTDSVRVEYRERIVHDTVTYTLPEIKASHVTDDTLSVLENDYAKSTAIVQDGMLYHDLQTKPTPLLIPVEFPVHELTVSEKKTEIRTVTKEVEKELTKWQKFRMDIGGWTLAALVLLIAIISFEPTLLKFLRL